MGKRASPGVGHNAGSELPKQADFRFHLAMEVLDQEEMAKIRERRKKHRKGAEGKGIVVEDLDRLYKMKDLTPDEVLHWFKRQWNALGSLFSDLNEQFNLFAPKPSAPEERAAFEHAGFMAGIQGKPAVAPPNMVGDNLQKWMKGHGEGAAFRVEAERQRLEEISQALDNADKGIVTDGTGKRTGRVKKTEADKVRQQAQEDFKADNPGSPATEEEMKEALANKASDAEGGEQGDFSEASEEELAAQTGRPAAAAAASEKMSQSQKAASRREAAGVSS